MPPRQAETLKKKIGAIFAKHGLSITAQANITRTDFLDVFFDLEANTYKSYNKPNNIPQYVHRLSNHPPSILKNIPEGVNKRLSSISSSEEMFIENTHIFQEALDKSEHSFKLKFNPQDPKPAPKNRKRKQAFFQT